MANPVASSGNGFYHFSMARVKENLVEPLRGTKLEMAEITELVVGCLLDGGYRIYLFDSSIAGDPGFKPLKERILQVGKSHKKEYEITEIPPPKEHPEYPYQFRLWEKGSSPEELPDRHTKGKPFLKFF